jgi:hypothetical protein
MSFLRRLLGRKSTEGSAGLTDLDACVVSLLDVARLEGADVIVFGKPLEDGLPRVTLAETCAASASRRLSEEELKNLKKEMDAFLKRTAGYPRHIWALFRKRIKSGLQPPVLQPSGLMPIWFRASGTWCELQPLPGGIVPDILTVIETLQ